MTQVATILADPKTPVLTDDLAARLARELPDVAGIETLNPGVAVDIAFAGGAVDPGVHERALRAAIGDVPLDVFVQNSEGRRKRLLIADMDSTMIGQECIDELAAMVGRKAEIAAITERAMRGELEFEPALRERAGMLAGLDASVIDKVIEESITLTPGARTLVCTMRANGAYCALVSGGFTAFTDRIARAVGFHEHRANTLMIEDDKLTGKVGEPILGREAKRQRLVEILAEQGLAAEAALAVGDGANDLSMIELAGLGVAYHAKPAVGAAADARIEHGDLTALLYLQGYGVEEFAEVD